MKRKIGIILSLFFYFGLSGMAGKVVYAQEDTGTAVEGSDLSEPRFMVIDSAFCEEIPPGKKWCDHTSGQFPSSVSRVYCATKIFATGKGEIYHNWYYRGERTDSVKLRILTSSGYRTRSFKTIRGRVGEWKVEVSAGGLVIETLKFTVSP